MPLFECILLHMTVNKIQQKQHRQLQLTSSFSFNRKLAEAIAHQTEGLSIMKLKHTLLSESNTSRMLHIPCGGFDKMELRPDFPTNSLEFCLVYETLVDSSEDIVTWVIIAADTINSIQESTRWGAILSFTAVNSSATHFRWHFGHLLWVILWS